ncbi:MAG: glycoside hydrolase domain-containing protein [Acidobacteriota bacterium]
MTVRITQSLKIVGNLLICWTLGPLAQIEKPAKDTQIWVLDDTDKVHPITGNLLSEGKEVYEGKRPSSGEYRKRNGVWDAASRMIRLSAGRNEVVGFQVVLEKGQDELHKVFLNATDLLSSKERISADSHIRLFKQLYLQLEGTWYPDALLPFEISGATPLELPDSLSVPNQRVQSVWVDIYVPQDLPPDIYTGQLMVLHRNTNKQDSLKIELEVGAFTLPDELNLDVDLMNYGFLSIERGWPDLELDGERHRKIEREFFRMAHAHRMTFATVPYNHDGSIPKGLKPELAGVGDSIRVNDWSAWDARFGPVLSGEAFQDLPRSRQPVKHFFLPYNLMWPSDIRHWKEPFYRTEHLRISRAFRNHLIEKGWTQTKYHIYYNHKEHYNFFPWNLDEPTRDQDLDALSYLGKILNECFPKDGKLDVLYRLDIGHFHCQNDPTCRYPKETSARVVEMLDPWVDLWNIGSPHYWANLTEVRKLRKHGNTMYFYSGTPRVAEPLGKAIHWGWQGFQYETDGICFWNATDWVDWDTDAPAADPYTNAGGRYQGFSMIFYPGSKFGYDGPIPSMRLKTLRRGLQDFEYLRLIEGTGKKTRGELIQLTNELLEGQVDYTRVRQSLFKTLSAPNN